MNTLTHLIRAASVALLASVVPALAQLSTEPFAGASNYSIIVHHDASFAGTHVALGGLFGGDVTFGAGANMEFGNRLTDGFALYVGGDVHPLGGGQVALFNNDYYLAHGTGGATLQNPGTALATSPLGSSVDAIFGALDTRAGQFNDAAAFGAVAAGSSVAGNHLTISVVSGATNVLTVDSGLAALLSDQNAEVDVSGLLDGDTRLIVNYVGDGDASALAFKAKTLGLGAGTYDQVIWNFSDVGTIAFSGDTFHGSIFAPGSAITWDANDLDGQLVADSYTSLAQREIHSSIYWSGPPTFTPVPEPSTYALAGAALLGLLIVRRRWRSAPLQDESSVRSGRCA
jgi:choice-of-anchor A domain-containing protein